MHPRVVLDEADARILYNNGESLIIAMAQKIGKAAKVQPALALVPPTMDASGSAEIGQDAKEAG
jgi:hypothetical protein